MNESGYSFHEATITALTGTPELVRIDLIEVSTSFGDQAIRIEIADVAIIEVDGVRMLEVDAPSADGEVLDLSLADDGVDVLVEWNWYGSDRKTMTVSYRFRGDVRVATTAV